MDSPTVIPVGPGDGWRTTVHTDGTISFCDRYGRHEIVLEFADLATSLDFASLAAEAARWKLDLVAGLAKAAQVNGQMELVR